ncbi:MAG: hypothetical protein NZM25_00930 [Leptospiraceae bacterium]|nr:hypothetical protein [Leptospiraceae bacterium]MDW8306287.1 hypothetical protein [Leptospiraceae bacterium]
MKKETRIRALSFLIGTISLYSYEIVVNVRNGTSPEKKVLPERVAVILAAEGMKEVAVQEKAQNPVIFANLPEPQGAPYLVQVQYQGVIYSQNLTGIRSPARIEVVVYEKTKAKSSLSLRLLAAVRYQDEGYLSVYHLYYFVNSTKKTYANSLGGVEVFLPEKAEDVSATVALSTEELNWLRLNPQKMSDGWFTLPYPVKPGERLFEVSYRLPYPKKEASVRFISPYAWSQNPKLMVDPQDLEVLLNDKPLKPRYEESLERNIYDLPVEKTIVLRGGTRLEAPREAPLEVSSPLAREEKLLLAMLSLLFFLGVAYVAYKKPLWLKKIYLKEKIRLEAEKLLWQEEKTIALSRVKEEKLKELERRIKTLEEFLENGKEGRAL